MVQQIALAFTTLQKKSFLIAHLISLKPLWLQFSAKTVSAFFK